MLIKLTEDDSCPKDVPGSLMVPDPGSNSCQKCEYNIETKGNENRVHDMCPIWLVTCGYLDTINN